MPSSTPPRLPRWSALSTALAAFGLGVVLTAGGLGFASRRRATESTPPSSVTEAWHPLASSPGVQRAGYSPPGPAEASGGICTPGRDTMVLELVPEGETEPRRILVRAVQPARGP
jgi:hypothetical protein